MASLQKITPHLWFDKNAKQAAEFYVSVFGNDSKVTSAQTIPGTPSGDTEIVTFELVGMKFMAISAGPLFKFTEAISFIITCEDQAEVDYFWDKLSAHPESEQCGWLKDKFGLSWQIVPKQMGEMMSKDSPEQMQRVTQAFLKMKKFDIAMLQKAYEGK